jgi:sugar phosphate isomerase/epimerase
VRAGEVGTRVALEPLPFSNVTDFRLAAELVVAADHPAAGLVLDIWHLERGPSTLADLAEIPGDKVFAVERPDGDRVGRSGRPVGDRCCGPGRSPA